MVKLSIIMPVYNEENFLKESITSVINQTLDNIELICIDDGSTDNSLKILQNFSKKYPFIKILKQKNKGSGKARNYGINEASGEYIGFLDADDFFVDTDALEQLYVTAKKNNAIMVSGNIKLVNQENKLISFKEMPYFDDYTIISPEQYGMPWAFYKNIFQKEFLIENNILFPDLLRGQDPVFLAEILSKIDEIYMVPTDIYAYRYINGAKQCNTFKKRFDHVTHYKMVFDYLKDPKFNQIIHRFRHEAIGFIDMMGIDGAKDTILSIQEIFKDNPKYLHDCEEYFYLKYMNFPHLKKLVNFSKDENKPRISVIIPVYNVEEFLDEALTSLLNQTFDDFELICVNDGSKDNSLNILNNFAKKDSRVKVFNKENGGCGSARNKALDEAKGDYIYFFDPDDRVLPNTFEELYKNAISNDSDLVMFKIARFIDGEPIDYSMPFYTFDEIFTDANFNHFTFNYKDIKHFVLNSAFAPWSKLYKKSFIDKYDDFRFDLNVAFDDVPFHVKTLLRAEKISFSPNYYYQYRYTNPNSVNNTASNAIDIIKIVDIVEDFLRKENFFEEFKEEFYKFKINQINMYIISSNSEDYFKLAKQKLSSMSIDNLKNVPVLLLKKFDLIMSSNSLIEFKLNNKIDELKFNNNYLDYDNNELARINENLKINVNNLTKENNDLSESNDDLVKEIHILEKNNFNINKDNDSLIKNNKNISNQINLLNDEQSTIKKEIVYFEKFKSNVTNSTSWKITEPLRKIKYIFK